MSSVVDITIQHGPLRDYITQLFAGHGVPEADAALLSDSLVEADLRGVRSHGLLMVPGYVGRIKRGEANLHPQFKTLRESGGTLLLDGDNGMGQVVAKRAMELAIGKARQNGIGVVGVCRSSHYAAGAYWGLKAVEQNMIGLALTGSGTSVAPYGGKTKLLGTHPWTIAVPAASEYPVVLDMATSVVAAGKLVWAATRGESVPTGIALDPDEKPTDDPNLGLAGRMLPFGSYKGYGFMVMVDMLATMLTGAAMPPEVMAAAASGAELNIGHYFQAIDIAAFIPVDAFKARVDEYVHMLKQSELEEGSSEILMPGEREFRMAARQRQEGIPYPTTLLSQIDAVGKEAGLIAPW